MPHHAKFLFCLPARFGVALISFLDFAISGFVGGSIWYYFVQHQSYLALGPKIMLIVVGALFSIFTFVALTGFFGAMFKKISLLRTFSRILLATFVLEVIMVAVYSALIFTIESGSFLASCVRVAEEANNAQAVASCNNQQNQIKGVLIGVMAAACLLRLYYWFVTDAYWRDLIKREENRSIILQTAAVNNYDTRYSSEDVRPLVGGHVQNGGYSFVDAAHSHPGPHNY